MTNLVTERRIIWYIVCMVLISSFGATVGQQSDCPPRSLTGASSLGMTCMRPCDCSSGSCICRKRSRECRCDGPCGLSCVRTGIQCPELQISGNLQSDGNDTPLSVGTVVTFDCSEGYQLTGPSSIRCKRDGQWSGATPQCWEVQSPKSCGDPGDIDNGIRIGRLYAYGMNVTYSCDPGYQLEGTKNRTCLSSGYWSDQEPVCLPVQCPSPDETANGVLIGNGNEYQSIRRVQCNEGYILNGEDDIECLTNQSWSRIPSCEVIECPSSEQPSNGMISGSGSGYRSIRRVQCNEGYTLQGEDTIECLANQSWSRLPSCKVVKCPTITKPTNGRRWGSGRLPYSIRHFGCDDGYDLQGDNWIVCQADGSWTNETPTCNRNPCSTGCYVPNVSNGRFTTDAMLLIVWLNYNSCRSERYIYVVCDTGYRLDPFFAHAFICAERGVYFLPYVSNPIPSCRPIET